MGFAALYPSYRFAFWRPVDALRLFCPACLMLAASIGLAGCVEQAGGYLPVSAIARDGFVSDEGAVAEARGQEVRVWGFVDQGNLYGDSGAQEILQELWSGEGPDAGTWRFDLKAGADDAVGRSFAVHVHDDAGRDDLLERFAVNARAGIPTKVYVRGRLVTFEAPTQVSDLTGLRLEVESSRDVRLAPAAGEP